VWVKKSMGGREFMGNERTTFVIDPDGNIKNILHKGEAGRARRDRARGRTGPLSPLRHSDRPRASIARKVFADGRARHSRRTPPPALPSDRPKCAEQDHHE
jgi:hypothetical protein